jgi:hypothetical protein
VEYREIDAVGSPVGLVWPTYQSTPSDIPGDCNYHSFYCKKKSIYTQTDCFSWHLLPPLCQWKPPPFLCFSACSDWQYQQGSLLNL